MGSDAVAVVAASLCWRWRPPASSAAQRPHGAAVAVTPGGLALLAQQRETCKAWRRPYEPYGLCALQDAPVHPFSQLDAQHPGFVFLHTRVRVVHPLVPHPHPRP
jgi:hypothetical protein